MATVVLLRGQPGSGKSFASIILKAHDCFDSVLHTDEIYVGYVFTRRPDLYVDNLRQCILDHYLQHEAKIQSEWFSYLIQIVAKEAKASRRLLVEGWQVSHCFLELGNALTSDGHGVKHVLAVGGLYIPDPAQTVDLNGLRAWIERQCESSHP